jgi:hypothetical protein
LLRRIANGVTSSKTEKEEGSLRDAPVSNLATQGWCQRTYVHVRTYLGTQGVCLSHSDIETHVLTGVCEATSIHT